MMVRSRRLELPRAFAHNDLNVARLPIPPRPLNHPEPFCNRSVVGGRLYQGDPDPASDSGSIIYAQGDFFRLFDGEWRKSAVLSAKENCRSMERSDGQEENRLRGLRKIRIRRRIFFPNVADRTEKTRRPGFGVTRFIPGIGRQEPASGLNDCRGRPCPQCRWPCRACGRGSSWRRGAAARRSRCAVPDRAGRHRASPSC